MLLALPPSVGRAGDRTTKHKATLPSLRVGGGDSDTASEVAASTGEAVGASVERALFKGYPSIPQKYTPAASRSRGVAR
jgi:hypothetical protein